MNYGLLRKFFKDAYTIYVDALYGSGVQKLERVMSMGIQ